MKYLITDKRYPTDAFDYKVINSTEAVNLIKEFIDNNPTLAFDIETTGLDAWTSTPLLYTIGNVEVQYVFEHYYCNKINLKKIFHYLREKNTRLLGHNIKFDLKFVLTNEGVSITNVYDTMIAEQRIWQKLGLRMGLAFLNSRYNNVEVEAMDKTIRMEFIGANPQYFKLELRHLEYAIGDILPLFKIKEKQDKSIYEKGLYNLIYKVEMPLISVVAKAEIEGFDFNLDKWRSIYNKNVVRKLKTEQKLDEEFRRLRDESDLTQLELLKCTGGKYDHKRVRSPLLNTFELDGTPKGVDLFGETSTRKAVTGRKSKIDFYPNDIKYTGDTIVELFVHLKEVLMTKNGFYEQPQLNKKGKVNKEYESFVTNEESLTKYSIDFPKSRMNLFIELILKQRKLSTRINNFGVNYDSKINPVTGKLHTIFRQCTAVTGRFQSGGGHKEPDKPNFQNIPSDTEMRSCFIAPKDWSIITSDYSGAELIVMCSLSQDMDLLEMSKRDMHSEIATACWRAVYDFRAKDYEGMIIKKSSITSSHSIISQQEVNRLYTKYFKLSKEFFIDKSVERKHLRTAFKPITFGVIYGLRDKNLSDYLAITLEEAQIIINVIRKMFPKVIKMVERCAKFAERNGYLILNNRTKSRAYFPNIVKELKGEYNRDMHFKEIMKDVNEARNIAIQGTQADAIKEASINIQKYIDKHKIRAIMLSWVHDEIIVKCHNDYINNNNLSYTTFKGRTYDNLNFAEIKKIIMIDTFNQYLTNVTIGVDYKVADCWTKD